MQLTMQAPRREEGGLATVMQHLLEQYPHLIPRLCLTLFPVPPQVWNINGIFSHVKIKKLENGPNFWNRKETFSMLFIQCSTLV